MSKNRRRGNGNTQACVLPRATLGLLLCYRTTYCSSGA